MTKKTKKLFIFSSIFSLLIILILMLTYLTKLNFRPERLEAMQSSLNYKDEKFHNLSPTVQITSDKSKISTMLGFLFRNIPHLRPDSALPAVKTNLRAFKSTDEILVWLGHSALFIQTNGKRFLIDPALKAAAPVSFINTPFEGSDIFTPDDIPNIDYLVISHDHYDHLDYGTVKSLKNRVGKVICPLGVGEYFEDWGYDKSQIIELDWYQKADLGDNFMIHALPARHFSGRGLYPNNTLWASFMLQTPTQNIYYSGDTGYDTHFAKIAEEFPEIDLAIMENGQYNEDWKYIHLTPEGLVKAINDLNPKRVLTVHNSKYALSKHPWYQPLLNISHSAKSHAFPLITPMIGEEVHLTSHNQLFTDWYLPKQAL